MTANEGRFSRMAKQSEDSDQDMTVVQTFKEGSIDAVIERHVAFDARPAFKLVIKYTRDLGKFSDPFSYPSCEVPSVLRATSRAQEWLKANA